MLLHPEKMPSREEILEQRRERKKEKQATQVRKWVVLVDGEIFGRAFSCTEETAVAHALHLFPELEPGQISLKIWDHVPFTDRQQAKRGFLIRPEIAAKI